MFEFDPRPERNIIIVNLKYSKALSLVITDYDGWKEMEIFRLQNWRRSFSFRL